MSDAPRRQGVDAEHRAVASSSPGGDPAGPYRASNQPWRRWILRESRLLLLGCAVGVSGCSDRTIEPLLEHRIETCEENCEVKLDPDCPLENISFADVDECVSYCASEEAVNWGLQDDGIDHCFDEQVSYYACFNELTCEDRRRHYDELNEDTQPCRPVLLELWKCNLEFD